VVGWIIWLVSHTIFIPFTFFFINTVAPQWRRAARWIIGIALGEAVFGIAARVLGAGHAADIAYRIEVVLYLPLLALMLFVPCRPAERQLWVIRAGFLVAFSFAVCTNLVELHLLPGRGDLEPLGFLVFLCCQGYVAAERTFRNEQHLVAINKELQIARSIQFGLLPSKDVTVSGLEIAAKYVPASSVAGDFYRRVGGGALTRWPPSAAQTVHAVFPHTAFTKTRDSKMQQKGQQTSGPFRSPVRLGRVFSILGR
jgi:phosphoserine phosphatase RsbU/P